jgi:hypothetical protein
VGDVMLKQTAGPGPRPAPAIKAGERELITQAEAGQEADEDESLNRLAQLLKPRTPPTPSLLPAADWGGAAHPPPREKRGLEKDSSRSRATAQGRSRKRALVSCALALPILAVIASFLTLNGGRGPPIATQQSRDDVVRKSVGAGPPPLKDRADPADVEAGRSAERPVGSAAMASIGGASPPAGPPNGLEPARPAPAVTALGDASTSSDVQAPQAEPRPARMPIPPSVSSAAESKESLLDATQSIPIVTDPAGDAAIGSTIQAPHAEPRPRATSSTSVSSGAESTKGQIGDEASQGPVKPRPKAAAEKAQVENPPTTHPGALSGSAPVAKIEGTRPSAPTMSRTLTAHAHPKRQKVTKAHNSAQAATEPPLTRSSTEAPPPPAEQAAQQGNPVPRALRAAAEPPPLPPAEIPPPQPAEPAAQLGDSFSRALQAATTKPLLPQPAKAVFGSRATGS